MAIRLREFTLFGKSRLMAADISYRRARQSVVLVAILGILFLHAKVLFRNWIGVVLIAIGASFVGWKP